jgi:predicted PurR-regulated permease PerM
VHQLDQTMIEKGSRNLILWVFSIYFIVSILMLGWLFRPFVSIMILGVTVTGLFNPVYRFFESKMQPAIASLLSCLIIFCVLFIPIVSMVGILSKEAYDLYLMARNAVLSNQIRMLLEDNRVIETINQWLANLNIQFTAADLNRAISEAGRVVGLYLYEQARAITSNVLSFIINFFLMLLVIYYLFIDQKRLLAFILNLSPLPDEQDQQLLRKFKDMAGAILIGNGLGGLIQGVLGGMAFALFGLRSPYLWGVIMGLLAFLPIVGIGLVFIPTAVILALTGRVAAGVFFIIFYALLSGGIEYLFKPRLVGRRVQMHTLLVFFSIIGGLNLFGILGIIYGPLIVTAFLTLTDIYRSSYQKPIESLET